ncbi:MAG: TIGR03936 family radical SAM-associated protein [Oscillospiraceae bacterium]
MTEKFEVRGVFEKKGRAVFISHLDLFRTMQRAMKRSGLPVWYSEGFNPRIYLNFPLALALGVESSCEIMDFEIVEQMPYNEMLEAVNRVLPDGIHFVSMSAPVSKNKEIAFSEYEFSLSSSLFSPEAVMEHFDAMMNLERIEAEKHSKKKGMILIDIKPNINVVSKETAEKCAILTVRLPAGQELNINSNVFIEALQKYCGIDDLEISTKRTKILKNNGEIFV